MKDNGTAEYAYRQSVVDRANAGKWRAEAYKRERAGKTATSTPVYSGLVSAFLN